MGVRLHLDAPSQDVEPTLTCKCSEVVMKSRGTDEVIRAKVLIVKGDQVFAVCKGCNTEVELPLMKAVKPTRKKTQESKLESADAGPILILKK
jgi:hypothetical protein